MSIKFDDLFDDDSGIFEQEEVKETVQPEEDLTKDSKEEIDDVDVEKEVKEIVDFESNDEDLFGNDDIEKVDEEEGRAPHSTKKNITNSQNTFISSLSAVYKEEGLIPDFNQEELDKIVKEEGEIAALKYLNDLQREAIAEELRKNYSEDKNELEEYFKLKDLGIDADLAKELIFDKATFDKITEDDLEDDEELRRKVLFQHYKNTTQFSETKIKKEIEKTIISGEDLEDAIEALNEVKKFTAARIEEEKQRVKEYEKQQKEAIVNEKKAFKEMVEKTDEIFKGEKLTKQLKEKITNMVLEPFTKLDNGQYLNAVWAERMKDPKKFDMLLAYHIATGTFYGNMDSLKKQAKSKAAEELEKAIKHTSTSIRGSKSTITDRDSINLAREFGINY